MRYTLWVATGKILYVFIKQLRMSVCQCVKIWTALGSVPILNCECPLFNRMRHGMVDRPGRKFDKYHPPSAEVKNEWSYAAFHSIRLHGEDMTALGFPWKASTSLTLRVMLNSDSVRLLLACNTLYSWGLYWAYRKNNFLLSSPFSCSNVRTSQKTVVQPEMKWNLLGSANLHPNLN